MESSDCVYYQATSDYKNMPSTTAILYTDEEQLHAPNNLTLVQVTKRIVPYFMLVILCVWLFAFFSITRDDREVLCKKVLIPLNNAQVPWQHDDGNICHYNSTGFILYSVGTVIYCLFSLVMVTIFATLFLFIALFLVVAHLFSWIESLKIVFLLVIACVLMFGETKSTTLSK
jgi:hypothetical protein